MLLFVKKSVVFVAGVVDNCNAEATDFSENPILRVHELMNALLCTVIDTCMCFSYAASVLLISTIESGNYLSEKVYVLITPFEYSLSKYKLRCTIYQPTLHCFITTECGRRPIEELNNARRKRDVDLGRRTVEERMKPLRIIGGSNADYGMYPWQVGIRKVLYKSRWRLVSSQWCGGTIIGQYWILSAAHCFDG